MPERPQVDDDRGDDDRVDDDREPDERLYTSEPLEAEDGTEYVIRQQNVGPGNEIGGGEWPDPDTPPRAPAPGAARDEVADAEDSRVSRRTDGPRAATSPTRRRPRPDPR
jgi:hypothetical protein